MTFPIITLAGEAVEHVPEPRRLVRYLMLATAMAAEGAADQNPERHEPLLRNCILMPKANLAIGGTGCRRPLMLREFASVCDGTGREGVIARLGDDLHPSLATFDIKPLGLSEMYCGYRMWMGTRCGPAWLIPSAGERLYVRFDPDGLDYVGTPPFLDDIDRQRGIRNAAHFLHIAALGWF